MALVPQSCTNASSIPYLSTSKTIHLRETVYEDDKLLIEDFVEELEGDEQIVYRQMVFHDMPSHIQSQLKLTYRNDKSKDL